MHSCLVYYKHGAFARGVLAIACVPCCFFEPSRSLFVSVCPECSTMGIPGDLDPSAPEVAAAVKQLGVDSVGFFERYNL